MSRKDFGTIVQIGDILVSEDVICEYFCCDYEACRGVCCIEGDSGAPLEEDESERMEQDYHHYSPLMTEEGKQAVADKGFFEIDIQGDCVTPLVGDPSIIAGAPGAPPSRACAFCHFGPGGECLCSIEKAGCKKPVSCSLYPVRVTRLSGGGLALNLHKWDICAPAFEKGRREGIRAWQFLERPLKDNYGEDFYEALTAAARHILKEDGI